MLKYLMKYEIKFIWKKLLIVLGVMLLVTAACAAAYGLLGKANFHDDESQMILAMLVYFAYYSIIVCVPFAAVIIIGVRFFKNVFGDEGYITNTLPVTGRQILWAKIIVNTVVMLIVSVALVVSMLFVLPAMIFAVDVNAAAELNDLMTVITSDIGYSLGKLAVIFFVDLVIGAISNVLNVYGAVCIGQCWKRYKGVGAVVSYILITIALAILGTVITLPVVVNSITAENSVNTAANIGTGLFDNIMLWSAGLSIVFAAIMYLIVDHRMTKKLNLE